MVWFPGGPVSFIQRVKKLHLMSVHSTPEPSSGKRVPFDLSLNRGMNGDSTRTSAKIAQNWS